MEPCRTMVTMLLMTIALTLGSAVSDEAPELPPKKQALLKDIRSLTVDLTRRIQPFFQDLLADTNITNDCLTSLLKTVGAARSNEEWALKMILSSGSIPTSLMNGGFASYGSFDQCRSVRRYNFEGQLDFRGQWCSIILPPEDSIVELLRPLVSLKQIIVRSPGQKTILPQKILGRNVGLKVGICTPSLCSQADLDYIVKKALSAYDITAQVSGCQTDEATGLSTTQKICLTLIAANFALVVVGTLVEATLEKSTISDFNALEILSFFSIRRNTRRLFQDSAESANSSLQFVNGLKVMLAFWVVLGHTYVIVQPDMFENVKDTYENTKRWFFQPIMNSFLAVEGFFFLSGFLLAYLTVTNGEALKNTCKKTHFSLVYSTIFIRRYIRTMIPALAMMVYSLLTPMFYDSPGANDGFLTLYVGNCANTWWKLPLMISNTDPVIEMCVAHTWYLAADVQLFVFALAVALLLNYKPRLALIISVSIVLVASVFTSVITYLRNYAYIITLQDLNFDRVMETFDAVYTQAYSHAPNYFLGIICGYSAAVHSNLVQSLRVRSLLWLATFLIAFYSMFGTIVWFRSGFPDPIPGALYAGFHRPLWGLAWFWFTYASVTGRNEYICEILSHRMFTAFGRLTFGVYLMHMVIISIKNGYLKASVVYMNHFIELKDTLGILMLSFFSAYVLNVTVEAPVAALDMKFFKTPKSTTTPNHKEKETLSFGNSVNQQHCLQTKM